VEIKLRQHLEKIKGIALILNKEEQKRYNINHQRSGDLVLMADEKSWFTYYFWLDDAKAPDYARSVDIHKKPGYDPVELFMTSKARAGYKLLRKKLGLRYVMDVIPLDANLVKGSHGSLVADSNFHPVFITDERVESHLIATDIYSIIWQHLTT
jgi:hypothetical protein